MTEHVRPMVTKDELTSSVALEAFGVADYRLRHNARYHGWSASKRDAYRLGKAFDAVVFYRALKPFIGQPINEQTIAYVAEAVRKAEASSATSASVAADQVETQSVTAAIPSTETECDAVQNGGLEPGFYWTRSTNPAYRGVFICEWSGEVWHSSGVSATSHPTEVQVLSPRLAWPSAGAAAMRQMDPVRRVDDEQLGGKGMTEASYTQIQTLGAAEEQARTSAHGDGGQQEQLTLGTMIAALERMPSAAQCHLHHPHSYRGYYDDLAFEMRGTPRSVGEVLADARKALGAEFSGYKGGSYRMDADTPVWVADYGNCGERLVSLSLLFGGVSIGTASEDA